MRGRVWWENVLAKVAHPPKTRERGGAPCYSQAPPQTRGWGTQKISPHLGNPGVGDPGFKNPPPF